MKPEKVNIVFTTLAIYQTEFFYLIGERLESFGFNVSYICFHERSFLFLKEKNKKAFNIYDYQLSNKPSFTLKEYGIDFLHLYLAYERIGSGKDPVALEKKFVNYIEIVSDILQSFPSDENTLMVQEYGGAISLVSSFFAAQYCNVDNIFFEPSFFRGRISVVHNNFAANKIKYNETVNLSEEMLDYLQKTLNDQKIVIPSKDSKQYRTPFKKLRDPKNIKRLFSKLYEKYILRNSEEWDYVGRHVFTHVNMLANSVRLKKYYQTIDKTDTFLYFPFHVPNDAALTIRSPEFVDQYALVDFLARSMPIGYKLAIKEHPALIGAIDYNKISQMLDCYDNLVLLDPSMNNYEVLKKSKAIITINSKTGAEALLLNKPVIILGDSFYQKAPGAIFLDSLSKLQASLLSICENSTPTNDTKIKQFFQNVWDSTYKGDLYNCNENNVNDFSQSIVQWIEDFGFADSK